MKRSALLLLAVAAAPLRCAGQSTAWTNAFDDDDAERSDWTEYATDAAERLAHPLNINLATRTDLQNLGLLNEEQIEDVLSLVFLNGPLRDMAELMALPSIDAHTRLLLGQLFYAEAVDSKRKHSTWKPIKQTLTTRLDIPLYYRRGYSVPASEGGYLGNPLYNKVQYRLSAGKHLSMGLRAEKDAGEPFRNNKGWDSYGGALQLKEMGVVENLVAGDYKLGFGEGLVVNQGYGFGKLYARGASSGIKPHFGSDEVNFMRGAALTLGWEHWHLSFWGSHRRLDATLTDEGEVKTLRTSGLHRTVSEMEGKANTRSSVAGMNVDWGSRGFHLGATAYYQHFNRTLEPGSQLYRAYYPRGDAFFLGGAHYGWRSSWFSFRGETASNGKKRGMATLNQLSWRPSVTTTLSVVQRHYGRNYCSFYGSSLSDCGSVQNETGGMLRLETLLWRRIQWTSYLDVFRNEWPARGETTGRRGQEVLVQASVTLWERHTVLLRYQMKRRGTSDSIPVHHRLRLRYTFQPNAVWALQWLGNLHALEGDVGWSVGQGVRGGTRNKIWRGALSATWFHTPSYATRVYVLEPTLRSSFSYPALSGRGIRAVACGQLSLWDGALRLEVRYAMTRRTDQDTQGSGMDLIRSAWRSDVQVQLSLEL